MLKEALMYLSRGYSVFPLHKKSKIPAVEWAEFQRRLPTVDEVTHWFDKRELNIAIVTGHISKLVVIDVDTIKDGNVEPIYKRFPTELVAKTGNGYHLYYKHPGWTVENRTGIQTGVDVRGDGGYVVAPPSVHPNGATYSWLNEIPW